MSQTFSQVADVMHETNLWRFDPKFRLVNSAGNVVIRSLRVDIELTPTGSDGGGGWAEIWNPAA